MSKFDHEDLDVYQTTINWVAWCNDLLESIPKSSAVHDQLDRASTSILLNIAEGNSKRTPLERSNFFDIARGSALECAACLDILVAKKRIHDFMADEGKRKLLEIVTMLLDLMDENSDPQDDENNSAPESSPET